MDDRKDLPPRLTVRFYTNRHGVQSTLYYYEKPRDECGKRECIPLGSNRQIAIARTIEFTRGLPSSETQSFEQFLASYFRRLRKNAKIRGIPFLLTIDDLAAMYQRSHGACEVSGIRFDLARLPNNWRVRPWVPSVDRIQSTGPYSVQNCRMVCFYVNQALNEFGLDIFLDVCRSTAGFSKMAKSF
jgi:hypothetical protein